MRRTSLGLVLSLAALGCGKDSSGTADGGSVDLTPPTPATGQYVVVWLTHLPAVAGGYRGTIAEVVVRGE